MTTPYHSGMPCDPLIVVQCPHPGCDLAMAGDGWIEHVDDHFHEWTPWTPDVPAHHHYRTIALVALVLAVAALLVAGGTR